MKARSPRAGSAVTARRANPDVHQEDCGQVIVTVKGPAEVTKRTRGVKHLF